MAKKNQQTLDYGGYVQLDLSEADIEIIDKAITAHKKTGISAIVEGWALSNWSFKLEPKDGAYRAVVYNADDRWDNGLAYYLACEGEVIADAVFGLWRKFTIWEEYGFPPPSQVTRGRFR